MTLKINGESQQIPNRAITVAELLVLNNVQNPETVSVQLNGNFVESKDYPLTKLQENDEVDFLYFLGGGQPLK